MKRTLALSLAAVSVLTTSVAFADPLETEAGAKGTLAIDQLSGFRASTADGIGYAGPIGFGISRTAVDTVTGTVTTTSATKRTRFWIAPSVDYFVIDHLSVGGLIEIAHTATTADTTTATTSTSVSLPGATNVTILPRVGYLIPVSDRIAIWPRAGIGFLSLQQAFGSAAGTAVATTSGAVIDIDASFIFRLTNNVYLKAAPDFAIGLGANTTTTTTSGTTTTVGPSESTAYYNFSILGGVGVFLPL